MSTPPSPPESVATIATRVVHDMMLLARACEAEGDHMAARIVAVAHSTVERILRRALDTTGRM